LKFILLAILLAAVLIYIDRLSHKKGPFMKGSPIKTWWKNFKDVITDKTYAIIFWRIVLLIIFIPLLATYLGVYFHKRKIEYVNTAPPGLTQAQPVAYTSNKPLTYYKRGVRYHISVPTEHTLVDWCLQDIEDVVVTWYRRNSNTIAMRNLFFRENGQAKVRRLYDDGDGWPGEYDVVFDRDVTVVETIIVR
jgi:hypothetical protein